MEISRKTDYALRMLAELVRNPGKVVSVRAASKNGGVPYSFARSIQHDLTLGRLITSTRGAHGGMRLAVDPKKTTLLDVVEAMQGPVFLTVTPFEGYDDEPEMEDAEDFAEVWQGAQQLLVKYFSSVTLYDIVIDNLVPVFDGEIKTVPADELPEDAE